MYKEESHLEEFEGPLRVTGLEVQPVNNVNDQHFTTLQGIPLRYILSKVVSVTLGSKPWKGFAWRITNQLSEYLLYRQAENSVRCGREQPMRSGIHPLPSLKSCWLFVDPGNLQLLLYSRVDER